MAGTSPRSESDDPMAIIAQTRGEDCVCKGKMRDCNWSLRHFQCGQAEAEPKAACSGGFARLKENTFNPSDKTVSLDNARLHTSSHQDI